MFSKAGYINANSGQGTQVLGTYAVPKNGYYLITYYGRGYGYMGQIRVAGILHTVSEYNEKIYLEEGQQVIGYLYTAGTTDTYAVMSIWG